MNAVTLGPAGTYSHRAARAVAAEVSFRESVTAIVDAVAAGEFERGVVPIENSIEGSVTESLDALADYDVSVTRGSSPRSDTPSSRRDRSSRSSPATRRRSRSVATGSKSTTRTRDSKRSRPRLAGSSAPARTPGRRDRASGQRRRRSGNSRRRHPGPHLQRDSLPRRGARVRTVRRRWEDDPDRLPERELPRSAAGTLGSVRRPQPQPLADRVAPERASLGDYLFHFDVDAGLYEEHMAKAVEDVEAIADNGWCACSGRTTPNMC